MLERTGLCCWDFSNHFTRALGHPFLFIPCSRCCKMKPESPTLPFGNPALQESLRMNSKGKDFFSAETCSCNSQCTQRQWYRLFKAQSQLLHFVHRFLLLLGRVFHCLCFHSVHSKHILPKGLTLSGSCVFTSDSIKVT